MNTNIEVDPRIVSMAQNGGASSFAQNQLNQIMNEPDYQKRSKNLSALRTSMDILNGRSLSNV